MYNLRSHPPTAIWKEIVNPSGERLSGMLSFGGLNKPPFPATSARRPPVCLTLYSKLSIKKDLHSRRHLSAHKSVNKNRRYNLELDFRVSLNLYPLLAILKKKKKNCWRREWLRGATAPQRGPRSRTFTRMLNTDGCQMLRVRPWPRMADFRIKLLKVPAETLTEFWVANVMLVWSCSWVHAACGRKWATGVWRMPWVLRKEIL